MLDMIIDPTYSHPVRQGILTGIAMTLPSMVFVLLYWLAMAIWGRCELRKSSENRKRRTNFLVDAPQWAADMVADMARSGPERAMHGDYWDVDYVYDPNLLVLEDEMNREKPLVSMMFEHCRRSQ